MSGFFSSLQNLIPGSKPPGAPAQAQTGGRRRTHRRRRGRKCRGGEGEAIAPLLDAALKQAGGRRRRRGSRKSRRGSRKHTRRHRR